MKRLGSSLHEEVEDLTFFIPWNLESNMPRVTVDTASVYLDNPMDCLRDRTKKFSVEFFLTFKKRCGLRHKNIVHEHRS